MQKEHIPEIELSVIAPMYNEESGIRRNINSFLETLKKRVDTWELILVDDGSTDSSLRFATEVADKEPGLIIVHYQPNRGRGYALRQGFRVARGKYIITTESDRSMLELHTQYVYIEKYKYLTNQEGYLFHRVFTRPIRFIGMPCQSWIVIVLFENNTKGISLASER